MLLLASTSDLIRVVSSSTSALDVQVSAMDLNTGTSAVSGYRANTAITTATTTTVAASPAASTLRTVKTLSVRNKGVATNVVTILHSDGTTIVEIIEATLAPDTSLQYHEAAGWWVTDSQGRAVSVQMGASGTPITDADTIVRLTADVVNNNATANTLANVTGLSFPMLAGKLYAFDFQIVYTAQATTNGSRWSVNSSVGTTYYHYRSEYSLAATTTTRNAQLTANDLPAASNATSGSTAGNWAQIYGLIQPTADGTLQARFASEIASSAITAKINSYVRYRQITP